MAKRLPTILGRWRIIEMEGGGESGVQPFVHFDPDGGGEFHFRCVHGFIDHRLLERDDQLVVGWSGKTDEIHLTKLLTTEFADRKPIWGWYDDTVKIMQKQIDCCADHGIGFWAFDWYYPGGETKTNPRNNALGLYLKAPNCQRLKFCILVVNDKSYHIGPNDWDGCCDTWIELLEVGTSGDCR